MVNIPIWTYANSCSIMKVHKGDTGMEELKKEIINLILSVKDKDTLEYISVLVKDVVNE